MSVAGGQPYHVAGLRVRTVPIEALDAQTCIARNKRALHPDPQPPESGGSVNVLRLACRCSTLHTTSGPATTEDLLHLEPRFSDSKDYGGPQNLDEVPGATIRSYKA